MCLLGEGGGPLHSCGVQMLTSLSLIRLTCDAKLSEPPRPVLERSPPGGLGRGLRRAPLLLLRMRALSDGKQRLIFPRGSSPGASGPPKTLSSSTLSCFLACRVPRLRRRAGRRRVGRRAAGVSPPRESLSSWASRQHSAVTPANSSLLGGGGVDGCIHRAAGHLLTEECRTLHSCETGKAKITGGYRLPAKYVIHTVGPIAQGDPSPSQVQELRNCYLNSLQLALENRLRSVAFPCISTGVFGYPNEAAAEVVLGTLRQWLEEHKDKVDRLIICVFLEKDELIYHKRLPHFFPVDAPTGLQSQL